LKVSRIYFTWAVKMVDRDYIQIIKSVNKLLFEDKIPKYNKAADGHELFG
jgi:hypothetical protein